MRKHHARILWLFLALLLVTGCSQMEPPPTVAPPTTEPPQQVAAQATTEELPLEFQLRQTPGLDLEPLPLEPFVVTLDNCAGENPLTHDYQQSLTLATKYTLDTEVQELDLSAYRGAMETVVRQGYGLSDTRVRSVEDAITLQVPLRSRGQFSMRWDELWDENQLDVLRGGKVVGAVPVRVLASAQLVTVTSRIESCAPGSDAPASEAPTGETPATSDTPASGTSSQANVPLVVSDKTPDPDAPRAREPLPVPELTAGPGSDESMSLVRDYLKALAANQPREAYDFLHEQYQQRLAYEDFAEAYNQVVGIEVHSVESYQLDKYHEMVRVGMTIATDVRGNTVYTDYFGIYHIVTTRGKPPYQRTISSSSLQPLRND